MRHGRRFTDSRFEGHPVAVVLEADELSTQQMQNVANEFSYAGTALVISTTAPEASVQIRIFTATCDFPKKKPQESTKLSSLRQAGFFAKTVSTA